MPDKAMIFAAGFGTRMGALTKHRPKPLIEVSGRALIDYALDHTRDLEEVVVNCHYHADQMRAHLAERGVTLIEERPEILETGGGLKNALPILGHDPVFTLNSDVIFTGDRPLETLAAAWDPAQMDALLLLVPLENAAEHRGQGDFFLDENGRLTRRGDAARAPYVYASCQIIKTDRLAGIADKAFSLNLLWDQMIQEGRASGVVHSGGWVDVGRPEGITVAEAMLADAP